MLERHPGISCEQRFESNREIVQFIEKMRRDENKDIERILGLFVQQLVIGPEDQYDLSINGCRSKSATLACIYFSLISDQQVIRFVDETRSKLAYVTINIDQLMINRVFEAKKEIRKPLIDNIFADIDYLSGTLKLMNALDPHLLSEVGRSMNCSVRYKVGIMLRAMMEGREASREKFIRSVAGDKQWKTAVTYVCASFDIDKYDLDKLYPDLKILDFE